MSMRMATVFENGKRVFNDLSKVDVLKETVYKFKNFADISKGSPLEKVEIGLPESLGQTNIFRNIFCNHRFKKGSQAPIHLNLGLIQKVWGEIEFDEQGNPNFESLKNEEYKKYIPVLENITEVYMPYLSVKENPNKFLKLVFDYRERSMVNVKHNDFTEILGQQPINSPTFPLYIGLDRIAQFLNFCVLINSLSTKKDNSIKKVEPLSFERDVLKKLLEQINNARTGLNALIKKCGSKNKTLGQYKDELYRYRKRYDEYVAKYKYEEGNGNQNVLDVMTFVEWMDNGVRNENGIDYSRLKNDKDELNIFLYFDSILQCEAAIDKFIDQKALEQSILNWFQHTWNRIKSAWNFLANKIGLSQGWLCGIVQEKKDMQFKSIEAIPGSNFIQDKFNDSQTK